MGLNHRPAISILMNGQDVTETLAERLLAIRCTEEAGLLADTAEMVLADEPAMPLPAIGTAIRLGLGLDLQRRQLGSFVCDEVSMTGTPRQLVIRARSAAFTDSAGGLSALQTRRRRSWSSVLSLDALVQAVSAEHGLRGAVSDNLKAERFAHLDQTDESDLHFLMRVARALGAVLRIHQGRLMVFREAQGYQGNDASGQGLRLRTDDVLSWEVWRAARDADPSVVACWHSLNHARCHEIRLGAGNVVHRIPGEYPSEAEAWRAARAEYERLRGGRAGLQLMMPGDAPVHVGVSVGLGGFREGVDGEWMPVRVERVLDRDGYRCNVWAVPSAVGNRPILAERRSGS